MRKRVNSGGTRSGGLAESQYMSSSTSIEEKKMEKKLSGSRNGPRPASRRGVLFPLHIGFEFSNHGTAVRRADRPTGAPSRTELHAPPQRSGNPRRTGRRGRIALPVRPPRRRYTHKLSAARTCRRRSRCFSPPSHGRRISLHAFLSPHSVRKSAVRGKKELPRNALPQRRSAHY